MNNAEKRAKGGETFLFCHGATSCGFYWRKVADILNELGHKTLAADMPGHGLDMTAEIGDMTMDDYARRAVDLARREGRKVILVGHSMGGGVITSAAELCPECVEKLIYVTAHMPLPGNSMNGMEDSLQPIDWAAGSEDGKTVSDAYMSIYRGEGEPPLAHMSAATAEACSRYATCESLSVLTLPLKHTRERWGSVPRYYVQTMQDAALWTALQQQYIDYWGCDAVYRMDSDHGVPCAAPIELAFILHDIAGERWRERVHETEVL